MIDKASKLNFTIVKMQKIPSKLKFQESVQHEDNQYNDLQ